MSPHPTFSLVIPVFNEDAVLPLLLLRLDLLLDSLDEPAEVIFVDDGSRDLTAFVLEQKARTDPRYRYAALSRNFGQQLAITAGLDLARGRAVILMDADLQDPPEVVPRLIAKWREGFDVVCAQRRSRHADSLFKRLSARGFYALLSRLAAVEIPANVGDFRLIDRKVVEVVKRLPERERFVRGLFSWVGFRHALVPFERPARGAGQTKYAVWKLTRLAANAVISFSEAPLRAALWGGMAVSGLAFLYGLGVIAHWLLAAHSQPGWSSTVVVIAFLGGANMMMTGIMGLYVGRIFAEVKGRPLYIVDRVVESTPQGDDRADDPAPAADLRGPTDAGGAPVGRGASRRIPA